MNLLTETIRSLADAGRTTADVRWCRADRPSEGYANSRFVQLTRECAWGEFAVWAEAHYSSYDSGFGTQEVTDSLMVVGDDWWLLLRREYDGSEWWEFMKKPERRGDAK